MERLLRPRDTRPLRNNALRIGRRRGVRGRRSSPYATEPPTTAEIRALLSHLLAGAVGGSEARWAKFVGDVESLPIVFHPRSNWHVQPTGSADEIDAIERAVAVVREAHPYVPSPGMS